MPAATADDTITSAPEDSPSGADDRTDTPPVTHEVLRRFTAAGIDREPGELVDATGWRTTRSLEAMRYIAPASPASVPVPCDCGRLWADGAVHTCAPARPDRKRGK